MSEAAAWADWIGRCVDDLVARGHIRSDRVEQAFRRVPRHRYIAACYTSGGRRVEVPKDEGAAIPAEVLRHVYSDSAPATQLEGKRPTSASTAPAVMAEMLEALDLQGGERVLEIGTGTGYNAALLAEITDAAVITVDHSEDVAEGARVSLRRLGEERVTVVAAEGFHGLAETGPYDRVIVTVGAPGIAEPWLDQLGLNGFVVAPVSVAGAHPVLRVERGRPWTAAGRGVCWADFMAGGGALADRDERAVSSAADGEPVVLDAPKVVRSFEPPLDEHAHEGLAAYVALADRRAGPGAVEIIDASLRNCVIRNHSGATAVFERSGVVVDGPDSFAREVVELTGRWLSVGCPRFTDWCCELMLQELPAGRFWRPLSWTTAGIARRSDPADSAQLPTGGHQHQGE